MMVIVTFLFILLIIAAVIATFRFPYFFLKPYLKDKEGRKLVFKSLAILSLLSIVAYAVGTYINSEPDYFEQGIEQLHTNKYVQKQIGGFNSCTFRDSQLPPKPTNPLVFNVELNGDSIDLYITCTMASHNGNWFLVKLRTDSIVKVKSE